jgi:hypothetical protein
VPTEYARELQKLRQQSCAGTVGIPPIHNPITGKVECRGEHDGEQKQDYKKQQKRHSRSGPQYAAKTVFFIFWLIAQVLPFLINSPADFER